MIQFFAPDIKETLELPESDSRHAVKVLRMREGDVRHTPAVLPTPTTSTPQSK